MIDSSGAAIAEASVLLTTQSGATAGSQSTSQSGLFTFAGLQPGTYDVQVERPNFATVKVTGVKVDIAREVALSKITLQPASVGQTVEVTAEADLAQTANATLLTTITNTQVARLPQLDRNVISIIKTQPGVGSNNRSTTVINGLRASYANVTIDGINIQDNYLRETSLEFQPNMLLLDQVSELTLTTSNASSEMGFGAAQVSLATPSGSGQFHGKAFWYNRNSSLAANTWFNNRDGLKDPDLNQNQFGGSFSGPLVKNKLYFYAGYESLRLDQETSQQRTILTDTARQGIFSYLDQGGAHQQINILNLKGAGFDPTMKSILDQVPGGSQINNYRIGDSRENLLLNTGGYSFLSRRNRRRTHVNGKLDYYASERHSLFGTYLWNSDMLDRPGLVSGVSYDPVPEIMNDNRINLVSVGWNSTWSPTFTNELRGGFNFAPGDFVRRNPEQPANILNTVFSSPYDPFPTQGRTSRTFNLADNAKWVKGNHTISFGFQLQHIRQNVWDTTLATPTYAIGISPLVLGASLTAADLPGASQANITAANNLLASLAGYIIQGQQRANAVSPSSGFVPGSALRRVWESRTYAGYLQDNWKLNSRLNLTLGVRYEYMAPVREIQGMALLPILENNNPIQTLLNPNGRIGFANQPMYRPDRNNFAPNMGLAWDITGDSKTVFRAGYSINYVNDNLIATIQNGPIQNAGLQSAVTRTYSTPVFASNLPAIPTIPYGVPRTHSENYAINAFGNIATFDPNLRTPYVQQWSAGIQRSFWGGVLEARYVGNRGTKQLRSIDYNQVDISNPGYATDFRNAYNNGVLAMQAGLPFSPYYNAAISGSQQLPFFASTGALPYLTSALLSGPLQRQEIGEMATYLQAYGLNGTTNFFQNPYVLGAAMLTNNGFSTYNAFQLDYTRRFAKGLSFQANYVFAKSLSDTNGDNQVNFEPYLDFNNPKVEKSPTIFDLRHAFKTNFVLELPFGRGKKFLQNTNSVVSQIVGGWSISGMTTLQSGAPFSVLSQRGTVNRVFGDRSTRNTATALIGGSDLNQIVSYYMTGNGPYMIAQSAINAADGRGVAADGRANFSGQAFANPNMGEIGALQRRMFTGPRFFNMDAGIQKAFSVAERHSLEFRMEAINAFNNVMFGALDMNINSASFGRITSQANSPRRVQFGLYYRF